MVRLLIVLCLVPRLAFADAVTAEAAPGEDATLYSCKHHIGMVAVTFKPETELKDLVTWVMGFTCKNFIMDPRIVATTRKVTVIAPKEMTTGEAYRAFLVALSTIGLAVVPKGNMLRIVESATAKREAVPIVKTTDDSDQYVRYVVRPSFAQAETLLAALVALKSDAGDVQQVGSFLLVTDYASHVRQMLSLVALIDVAKGSDGIYTIPLQHANATKLADKLAAILGLTPATGKPGVPPVAPSSKIWVDDRTNTLIVTASEAGYRRIQALVDRLDIALGIDGGASIHVYQLGNAIAEEVAKTLNDAITRQTSPTAARPPGATPSVAPGDGLALEGQVHVIADKATNKLIVTSSGRDFLAIREVIEALDEPRRQVYIETRDPRRRAGRRARRRIELARRAAGPEWQRARARRRADLEAQIDRHQGFARRRLGPDRRPGRRPARELADHPWPQHPVVRDPVPGARHDVEYPRDLDPEHHRGRQRAGDVHDRHEHPVQEGRRADLLGESAGGGDDQHRPPAARVQARHQASHLDE